MAIAIMKPSAPRSKKEPGYIYHIRHQNAEKAKSKAAMSNTASETLNHLKVVLSQWSEETLTLVPMSMDTQQCTHTEVEISHEASHQMVLGHSVLRESLNTLFLEGMQR
jgi:hypothetical protein